MLISLNTFVKNYLTIKQPWSCIFKKKIDSNQLPAPIWKHINSIQYTGGIYFCYDYYINRKSSKESGLKLFLLLDVRWSLSKTLMFGFLCETVDYMLAQS